MRTILKYPVKVYIKGVLFNNITVHIHTFNFSIFWMIYSMNKITDRIHKKKQLWRSTIYVINYI